MDEFEEALGFDEYAERRKYNASARRLMDRNGFEPVVYDNETKREVWAGATAQPNELEAMRVARAYLDALVDCARKVHVLRERRRSALPGRLMHNIRRLDELARERKKVSAETKALEAENRTLIDEAEDPRVVIEFSESLGSARLVVTQGGKDLKDDRQQEFDLDAPDEDAVAVPEDDAAPDADEWMAVWAPEGAETAPTPAEVSEGDGETGDTEGDPPAPDGSPTRETVVRAIHESTTKTQAARALGLSLFQLRVRLDELGLDWKVEREKAKQAKRPGLNPADVVWPKKQAKKRGGKKAGTKAADKPAKRVRHDEGLR